MGENNREAEHKRWVLSERSVASAVQWKISISHGNRSGPPCCIVTDLTCPPDIHSQSFQHYNYFLHPSVYPSIYLSQILSLRFYCHFTLMVFPSYAFSSSAFTLFLIPLSLLTFSLSDSWALTAFYISFSSATVREQPGIGGLVQINRRPCGSPRVATRHNKPPAPGRRMHRRIAQGPHYGGRGPNGTWRSVVSMTTRRQH